MAVRDRITVYPPDGETVVVDISHDGESVGTALAFGTAFAERSAEHSNLPTTLTLPLTITTPTSFYLAPGGGPYDVSVKLGDTEIAGPDETPVTVSNFPAEIRATIDTAELTDIVGVPSGGSSAVGKLCWFHKTGTAAGPGDAALSWLAATDGVAPFTDATASATEITIVNGGAWHWNVTAQLNNSGAVADVDLGITIRRNDDSVGPLYTLTPSSHVAAGSVGSLSFGFDIDLDDGDVLIFTATGLVADGYVPFAVLSGRRLGDVAA